MNNEEIQLAQEKEELKDAEQQRKFEKYQMKNLGGFEKIFPLKPANLKERLDTGESEDDFERYNKVAMHQQIKIENYEAIRNFAGTLFNNQFGVRKLPT